jgi:hypothetical protein
MHKMLQVGESLAFKGPIMKYPYSANIKKEIGMIAGDYKWQQGATFLILLQRSHHHARWLSLRSESSQMQNMPGTAR